MLEGGRGGSQMRVVVAEDVRDATAGLSTFTEVSQAVLHYCRSRGSPTSRRLYPSSSFVGQRSSEAVNRIPHQRHGLVARR